MQPRPRVLLFDLGGVLVDFAGFEELDLLLPEALSASEIRARWLGSAPVREFELGQIAPEEFAERFVSDWRLPLSPAEFIESFANWFRGFYPGVSQLLQALATRHRLACLSNSNEIHWAAHGPALAPYFEATFVSHELGLAKPEIEIFRIVVSKLEVAAEEILFFDDSEANVESAAKAGLQTELVRGPYELRAALARHRLVGG